MCVCGMCAFMGIDAWMCDMCMDVYVPCMCVCACVYVVCAYVHACVYVYMWHVCTWCVYFANGRVCVYVHVAGCVCVHGCMCVYVYLYVLKINDPSMHVCMYLCMYNV